MRTTVAKLIVDAVESGKNTTASDGRWKCRINVGIDAYIITHHTTDMMVVYGPRSKQPGAVYPLDPGWGSQTDKQGITSMLREMGIDETYHSIYSGKPEESSRIEGPVDLWCSRCVASTDHITSEHPEPPKPDLEPFTPPLTVEDTMG